MKKPVNKKIIKEVCLECGQHVRDLLTKCKSDYKLAGADFCCEWCDTLIPKYTRHQIFYKIKRG